MARPRDSSTVPPIARAGYRVRPPPLVAWNSPQGLCSGPQGQEGGISPEWLTDQDGLQPILETWGTCRLGSWTKSGSPGSLSTCRYGVGAGHLWISPVS